MAGAPTSYFRAIFIIGEKKLGSRKAEWQPHGSRSGRKIQEDNHLLPFSFPAESIHIPVLFIQERVFAINQDRYMFFSQGCQLPEIVETAIGILFLRGCIDLPVICGKL